MHLLATRLLQSVDLSAVQSKVDTASHAGTVPLVIVALILFVAAVVVRKIIKLAIVVVVAGIVALLFAGWRAGMFG